MVAEELDEAETAVLEMFKLLDLGTEEPRRYDKTLRETGQQKLARIEQLRLALAESGE